ncbi:hypothetical protein M9H77_03591 [Catharanthus roseus]|uniref:Uncharacterized protein n=1 Tax=Catharanthus roseus TaxID=4058 RepID=A0ACC0CC72_CATRO|nr:hypothetical protein M9H77_03591 [Catharanthus roseus]
MMTHAVQLLLFPTSFIPTVPYSPASPNSWNSQKTSTKPGVLYSISLNAGHILTRKREHGTKYMIMEIKTMSRFVPNPDFDISHIVLVCDNSIYPEAILEIHVMFLRLWQFEWELFTSFSPFFVPSTADSGCVSYVLGAKDAHTMSPHLAQLLYFSLVSALFMAPAHFSLDHVAAVAQSFWKNKPHSILGWCIAFIAGCLSVCFFSIAHTYLLADNRHYTFYLWQKVVNAHSLIKYFLVPLYAYSWFSISNILDMGFGILPDFSSNTSPCSTNRVQILHKYSLLLMGMLYIAINIFTMFMFLFPPFSWNHEAGIQRFLWVVDFAYLPNCQQIEIMELSFIALVIQAERRQIGPSSSPLLLDVRCSELAAAHRRSSPSVTAQPLLIDAVVAALIFFTKKQMHSARPFFLLVVWLLDMFFLWSTEGCQIRPSPSSLLLALRYLELVAAHCKSPPSVARRHHRYSSHLLHRKTDTQCSSVFLAGRPIARSVLPVVNFRELLPEKKKEAISAEEEEEGPDYYFVIV